MIKFKRDKSNTAGNLAKQGNKINGGVTINNTDNSKDFNQFMLENMTEIKESLNENHLTLTKLTKAFSIYVENNGVKPAIKKIVKEILE